MEVGGASSRRTAESRGSNTVPLRPLEVAKGPEAGARFAIPARPVTSRFRRPEARKWAPGHLQSRHNSRRLDRQVAVLEAVRDAIGEFLAQVVSDHALAVGKAPAT
jgi:hypothetical protein